MTITKDGKKIRVNKDGSLDRRYKEGAKIQKPQDKIASKYNWINRQVNIKVAKRQREIDRNYKFIKITAIATLIVILIWILQNIAFALTPKPKIITPVTMLETPIEVQVDEPKEQTIEEQICNYTWDCQKAIAIAKCESTLNPNAWVIEPNNTISVGLFQINSVHFKKYGGIQNVLNNNIEVAYNIYKDWGHNFNAWTCNRLINY